MTASRKKLALSSETSTSQPSASTSEDGARFGPCDSEYHLIRMSSLKTAVSVFSCCGSPLTVTEDRQSRRGLVSKISVCGKKSLVTDPYRKEDLAVYSRSILEIRVIGKGSASLEIFTGIMGMLPPLSKPHFSSHTKAIHLASTAKKENQFSAAVENLRKLAKDDEIVDIQVTCDWTWSRRGHQAIYSIVVIDSEVLSKYCAECMQREERTLPLKTSCIGMTNNKHSIKWITMVPRMIEADGVVVMWQGYIEKYKLRYTSVIADGDAKTYKAICDAKLYGPGIEIEKHECLGHVQKRMINHLKPLKMSSPMDSDGRHVRIGRRNRITDVVMMRFQR